MCEGFRLKETAHTLLLNMQTAHRTTFTRDYTRNYFEIRRPAYNPPDYDLIYGGDIPSRGKPLPPPSTPSTHFLTTRDRILQFVIVLYYYM